MRTYVATLVLAFTPLAASAQGLWDEADKDLMSIDREYRNSYSYDRALPGAPLGAVPTPTRSIYGVPPPENQAEAIERYNYDHQMDSFKHGLLQPGYNAPLGQREEKLGQ